MAVTWLSGGEHGVTPINATNNALVQTIMTNAPVLDSTTKRTGTNSIKFAPTSAVDWGFQMTSASVQVHVFSYWVYWETLASGAGTDPRALLGQIDGGGGANYMGLAVDPADNSIRTWHHNGVSLTWQSTGPVITTGRWYHIDMLILTNGTTWSVDWRLDGIAQPQGTWTGKAATNSAGQFNAFCSTATQHVIYVDDFLYSNTQADYPFGPHAIIALVPTSAAVHQSITTTEWQYTDDFSVFNNFVSATEVESATRIDDLNTTDGIRMNGGASGQAGNGRWNLNDPIHPSPKPVALRSLTNFTRASAATDNYTVRIRSASGTTSNIFSGAPATTTPTWTNAVLLSTDCPGGTGWTLKEVEGLTLEMDSTDTNPAVHVGGYVGEMAYSVSAGFANSAVPIKANFIEARPADPLKRF